VLPIRLRQPPLSGKQIVRWRTTFPT